MSKHCPISGVTDTSELTEHCLSCMAVRPARPIFPQHPWPRKFRQPKSLEATPGYEGGSQSN